MATFSLDVSRWCEKAKDRADLVIRKVALDAFSRVILKTPVDTGRARGNWQVAIGAIPTGTLVINDKAGTATIAKVQAASLGLKAGDVIYLVNNLPYARRLEYGWSKQAPGGMVRIAIARWNAIVSKATTEAKAEKP